MSGLKSNENIERLGELGMPTLEERRHQADMAMVHKITNRRGGLDPSQWFVMAAVTRGAATPSQPENAVGPHGDQATCESGG